MPYRAWGFLLYSTYSIQIMTTVSLHELMTLRDEAIASNRVRPRPFARAYARVRRIDLAPARRRALLVIIRSVMFASAHGLVLAACCSFVIGAATLSPIAGWIMAGVSLLFLELRRR